MSNADRDASQYVMSFGPFRLFVGERRLERCVPVRLGRRALGILVALAERATSVVSDEELHAAVWPDRPVNEGTLRLQVAALRRALGGRRSGTYVMKVAGRGYRLVASTSRATLTPSAPENDRPSSARQLDDASSFGRLDAPPSERHARFHGERLRQVLQFVEANLQADIRVEDLARVARLSQFHFSRAFRRATGQTPFHFVRSRRLEKAKEMLGEGEVSLTDIAFITNYSSQASFTRAFSRAFGVSPGEYRRLHRADRFGSKQQDR